LRTAERAAYGGAAQEFTALYGHDQSRYGARVEMELEPLFVKAGVNYPPSSLVLLGLKEERILEVWAYDKMGKPRKVVQYPILAASGNAGPKLREGDRQVPEGKYRIEGLNPNSSYHLSLKLNYPNEFDRRIAKAENRINLGGDIFIHGNSVSIGCLAIGDKAIEELFILVSKVGKDRVTAIIVPYDFRARAPSMGNAQAWLDELYRGLERDLVSYREAKL
jgi:murein L,D-transpeptidase YafK